MSNNKVSTGTAKRLHDTKGSRGDAAVYELTPPLPLTRYDYEKGGDVEAGETRCVVVSAVDLDFGGFSVPGYRTSETMIFPSDGEGVTDFGELAMVPYKSHADALEQIGYEVAS